MKKFHGMAFMILNATQRFYFGGLGGGVVPLWGVLNFVWEVMWTSMSFLNIELFMLKSYWN